MLLAGCATAFAEPAEQDMRWRQSPPEGIAVGDLVFRRGKGYWTPFFISISSREKRFSHVGIVSGVASNAVDILHSDADETSGRGFVRIQDWRGFFDDTLEGAVYRYEGPADTRRKFAENGRGKLGVPFDSLFDMRTTNRLYCTEFVRWAVNESVGRELVGYTLVGELPFIALDDIYRRAFIKTWDSRDVRQRP